MYDFSHECNIELSCKYHISQNANIFGRTISYRREQKDFKNI